MKRMQIIGPVLALALVPLAAWAAASAQQDYLDAVRLTPNLDRGAQLYGTCVSCHGPAGAGSADDRVPRIAGQHARVIIRQLVDYRYDKRWDPDMEGVADKHARHKASDLADIAGYVASLPASGPVETGRGEYLEVGRQTYRDRCAKCHGTAGQGDAREPVPRLAGQHYFYLLRQLHDAIDGRRPQLARSHAALLQDLDRDALQGLADLMSRTQREMNARAGR